MATIDNRVVKVDLDNANFQAKVVQTLGSIQQLASGMSKTSEIKLDTVTKGVETMNKAFSVGGIAAIAGVTKLTNGVIDAGLKMGRALVDPIVEGGKRRALNIEQAKLQFKGLGLDVDATMASASAAVKGTAYSLDEAARVAGVFGAGGVKAGDEMTTALKAVAGTAAMTGARYMEIGDIFGDVAAKGRATAEDFNRLTNRGVSGSAVISEYLREVEGQSDVTMASIEDLARKGQITAEIFQNAFSWKFGDAAAAANTTFTGSLSNMNSALSRIGEMFITVKNNSLIPYHNAAAKAFDAIKDALAPVIPLYNALVTSQANMKIAGFEALAKVANHLVVPMAYLTNIVHNFRMAIIEVLSPIGKAFADTFKLSGGLTKLYWAFRNGLVAISDWSAKLRNNEGAQKAVYNATKALLLPFKVLHTVLSTVAKIVGTILVGSFKLLKMGIDGVNVPISKLIKWIKNLISQASSLGDTLGKALSPLKSFFSGIKFESPDKLLDFFKDFKSNMKGLDFGKNPLEFLKGLGSSFKVKKPDLGGDNVKAQLAGMKLASADLSDRGLPKLSEGFAKAKTSINEFISTDVAGWAQSAKNGLENFKSGLSGIGDGFSKVGSSIKTGASNVKAFIDSGQAVNGIRDGFMAVLDVIKAVAETAANFYNDLKAMFKTLFKDVNVTDMALAINSVGMTVILAKLIGFAKNLSKGFGEIGDKVTSFKDGIKDALSPLSDLGDALKKFGEESTASKIMKIAVAIALLAAALYVLSLIEMNKILPALGAMAGTVAMMTASIAGIAVATKTLDPAKLNSIAIVLVAMAVAILIFAFAMEKLGKMRLQDIGKGVVGVAAAIGLMVFAAKQLDKLDADKSLIKMAIGMVAVAVALIIFAKAVERMGRIDMGSLAKGLGGIAVALGLMIGVVWAMDKIGADKSLASIGFGMLIMAAALWVMSKVLLSLAQIPWDTFIYGFGLLAMMLGIMVIAAVGLGLAGNNILKASIAFGIFVISLVALIGVMLLLTLIPWETFLSGFERLALVVGLAVAALLLLSLSASNVLTAAFAMGIMALAILGMSAAVMILGSMDMNALVQGILALGIMLAGLVIAANSMVGAAAGAGAMIVMAIAIGILAVALWALAGLSIDQIINGLIAIGGAMLILVVAAYAAQAASVGLGMIAAVLFGLAAAALLVGVGMILFAVGLAMLGPAAASAAGGIALLAEAATNSLDAFIPLIALGAGLLVLGVGMLIAGAGALILGVGLLAMGAGLMLIAIAAPIGALALKTLIKSFGWKDIGKAAALGAALVVLGAGILAIGLGSLAMALGIGLAMIALAGFRLALEALKKSASGLEDTYAQLQTLSEKLKLFATAAEGVSARINTVLAPLKNMQTTFGTMGISILLVTTNLMLFKTALETLQTAASTASSLVIIAMITMGVGVMIALTTLNANVSQNSEAFKTAISTMGPAAQEGMAMIATAIISAIPIITAASFTVALAFSAALSQMPMAATGVAGLVYAAFVLMSALVTIGLAIVVAAVQNGKSNFQSALSDIRSVTVRGMSEITQAISNEGPQMGAAGRQAVDMMFRTIVGAIYGGQGGAVSAAQTVGYNISYGMASGIYNGSGAVASAARSVASAALASAKATLDIHSPSRKMAVLGRFFDAGFVKGIDDGQAGVVRSAGRVARSALGTVENIMSSANLDTFGGLFEDPVIKPVVDLSDVQSKSAEISKFMSATGSIDGPTFNRAISAQSRYKVNQEEKQLVGSSEAVDNSKSIVYNQYNNSPKALSAQEIYRQTRNQLATLKESEDA